MSPAMDMQGTAAVVAAVTAAAWAAQPWLRSQAGLPVIDRRPETPVGATALMTVLAYAAVGSLRPALLALVVLAVLTPILVEADLAQRRLPMVLTRPTITISALTFAVDGATEGTLQRTGGAAVVGLVTWTVFAALRVLSRGGMGRGDLTLAGLLGLQLGWLSPGTAALGLFLAFTLATIGLLPAIASSAVFRHTKVAFGPFLLLGAWSAVTAASTPTIADAASVPSWMPMLALLIVLLTVALTASRWALRTPRPVDTAIAPSPRRPVSPPGHTASASRPRPSNRRTAGERA